MRLTTLFLLSSLFTAAAQATALPTEVIEIMDQYRIALYLTEEQISSIPQWQPGDGEPPMSLQAAVGRVLEWIARTPSLADAQIYELKYKPVHNYEKLNRWYYLVEFRMRAGKKRFVAVLPDGQVVSAIEEPGR
jgi:hypothetical protein